ncbi:MAG: radical SAM protein [Thermodesulfobacteriota bacterium]|nr:radical SAM protein [Thermodesulfobacteriota bacterium]
MIKLLFVSLPSALEVYKKTNVKLAAPSYPNLSLATIAGNLSTDVTVDLIDLDFYNDYIAVLKERIDSFKPDFIAMEVKTVTFNASERVSHFIRKNYPKIRIIAGGVHITTFAAELCKTDLYDSMVIGEGDFSLNHILNSNTDMPNILSQSDSVDHNVKKANDFFALKKNDRYVDIEKVAFPRWDLFNIQKYRNSHLTARANPVGLIETSRGCAFQCNFCNKNTFGRFYRAKSVGRVVEEFKCLKAEGFKEVHIIDDSFTQDLARAKSICEELIRIGYDIPWSMFSGVRVDLVDQEFFHLAKRAGAWQVAFGIESGNQKILDRINKKTKLQQIEDSVSMAVKSGMETMGFFIIGLSGDTEKTIMDTINFAAKLPLSLAKFDICIPYPGTPFYKELDAENRILTKDWSKYICHQTRVPLFEHPNLTWEQLDYYYNIAFRKFFLRPRFLWKRFIRDIKKGDLLSDVSYFTKSILNKSW